MIPQSIYKSAAGEKAVMDLYDAALARWPVPYITRNIQTKFGTTFIIQSGEPTYPPVVLLHGAGTNSTMWGDKMSVLSHKYHVIAIDLPGEPGKSAPDRIPWEGPAWSEWLDGVLEELRLNRVALIGLSQGGWVAAKYAAYRPERVNKLILMTPAGIVPDNLWFAGVAIPLSLTGSLGIKVVIWLLFGRQAAPKDLAETMYLVMKNFKPRIGIVPFLSDIELLRLTMPTLLVMGARDVLRNWKRLSRRLETYVPNLRTFVLPEDGHAIIHFTDHLPDFLAM